MPTTMAQHQQQQRQPQDAARGLTIELISARAGSKDEIGSVRRNELSDGGTRLTMTLPCMIDGEQANLTAALLLEQIDRLPYRSFVERVKLHGLQFTTEGVTGIKGFLSVHAASIKHVSLKDIMTGDYKNEDAEAFASLANVFQSSKLETLNLSDNTINASLWRNWAPHSQLRQLILDYVHMDDESVMELQKHFTFGESLEELYVVLTNHIGKRGLHAANNILKCSRKISSLRWAMKDAPPDAMLPWLGLAEMALDMSSSNTSSGSGRGGASLIHLVMDGGTMSPEEAGDKGLAGALKYLKQLKTLKLRCVGLTDTYARYVTASLLEAKPPLENIDLSRNQIQSVGASVLSQLCEVENITKHLTILALDRNGIEAGGARALLEAFGSANAGHSKLEIKLDGNPFHFGKVAYSLAYRKGQVESERDALLQEKEAMKDKIKELETTTSRVGGGGSMRSDKSDLLLLQDEIAKLQEEKAALIHAFSVIGSLHQVRDQTRLFDRVSRLESAVFATTTPNNDDGYYEPRPSVAAGGGGGGRLHTFLRSASTASTGVDEPTTTQRGGGGGHRSGPRAERRRSLNNNSVCDSPSGKSTATTATRSRKTTSHDDGTTPTNRRTLRDLGISGSGGNNVMIRDASERWGISPAVKSKPQIQAPQGLLNLYPLSAAPLKTRSKTTGLDMDEASKTTTNHSRSTHSDRMNPLLDYSHVSK